MFTRSGAKSDHDLDGYPQGVQYVAKNARVVGLVFTGTSVLLGKILLYDEYERIRLTHPDHFWLSADVVIILYIALVLGISYLIWGKRAVLFFARKKSEGRKIRPSQLAFSIVVGLVGFGVYIWFQNQLAALGYKF